MSSREFTTAHFKIARLTIVLGLILFYCSRHAMAIEFTQIAEEEGVDPYELYAVLIVESGMDTDGDDILSPHPFTIRYGKGVVKRLATEASLRKEVERASSLHPDWTIDVGWGQINRKWQSKYFEEDSPLNPYDPVDNLRIAARVLREAIASTPDKVLGLGRYNTWKDTGTARWYGARVGYLAQILKERAEKKGI